MFSIQDANSYLTLTKNEKSSMQLSWNFKNIKTKAKTQYHLLIFENKNLNQAKAVVKYYYSLIKSGHIIGVVLKKKNGQYRIEWNQKTLLEDVSALDNIFDSAYPIQDRQQAVEFAIKNIGNKKNCICFLNYFNLEYLDKDFSKGITKQFTEKRKNHKFSDNTLVSLFFTDTLNLIQATTGINVFQLRKQLVYQFEHYVAFYKILSFVYLKIRIQIESDYMIRCQSQEWQAVDFNCFEKKYYGIPAITFNEDLYFESPFQQKQKIVAVKFDLEVLYCDGRKEKSQIQFQTNIYITQSLTQTFPTRKQFYGNICLGKRIFVSTNYIDKVCFFNAVKNDIC